MRDIIRALVVAVLVMVAPKLWEEHRWDVAQSNVVKVTGREGTSGGTGFFTYVGDRLMVITNAHVCEGVREGSAVYLRNLKDIGTGQVVLIGRSVDLCLIEPKFTFHASGLPISTEVNDGETITVYGHPLLRGFTAYSGRVVGKTIATLLSRFLPSAKSTCPPGEQRIDLNMLFFSVPACTREYDVIDISANTYPGNSGSPVLNKYGRVVGVIFIADTRNDEGGMVPLSELTKFISEARILLHTH